MIASLDDAIEYEKQEMAWKLKYEMIDGFPEKIAKHKRRKQLKAMRHKKK